MATKRIIEIATQNTNPAASATLLEVDSVANGTEKVSVEDLRATGWGNYADSYYADSGTPFEMSASTTYELPVNAQSSISTYLPSDVTTFYTPTSLAYDAEAGTFTAGLVLTGGTSGATATITGVQDDGTTGVLFLSDVSGTFQNDENITDSSTGDATADGVLNQGGVEGIEGEAYVITVDFIAKPTNPSTTYIEIWIDIGGAVGELYRRIVSFPKGNGVERPITISTGVYTLDTWEANRGTVYIEANNTCEVYAPRIVVMRTHKV